MIMGISVANGDDDLKQVWRLLLKGALILLCIGCFLGGCVYFNRYMELPDDHPAEQFAEYLIEDYLDLPPNSLDFTPNE